MSRKSQTRKHRTGRKLNGFTEVYDESRDGPRTKPKKKDETVTYNKTWAEMVDGSPTGHEVHGVSNGDNLINGDETMTIDDPLKGKDIEGAGFEIINEDEDDNDIESDVNTDPENADENGSPTNETRAEEYADEPEPTSDQSEDDDNGEGESDDEEEDESESESDEDGDTDETEEEDTDESDEDVPDTDEEDGPESETEVEVLPDDEQGEDGIEDNEETQESNPDSDKLPSENSDNEEDMDDDDDDEVETLEDEDTDKSDEDENEDEDEDETPSAPESNMDTEADLTPVNRIIPISNTPARHPVQKKKKSIFKLNIGKGHAKKKKENSTPKEKVPLKKKWHEWWFGTEEHPVKPFSFKGKVTRWFLKTFCGYVDYITTMYDKPLDEIRCDIELVKKSKVPREAVHVTNMKRTYHLDLDLPIRYFDVTRDFGFTASSAYNYAKDNSITDAMAIDIDNDKPPMETGKILLIVALVFGAVLAIWFMWPMYAQ